MTRVSFNRRPLAETVLIAASLLEATTLAALVLIAVPLKHLAGIDMATGIAGPIHGAAFLLYVWALLQVTFSGSWRPGEVVRMLAVALLPLAGFMNQPWLRRKLQLARGSLAVP